MIRMEEDVNEEEEQINIPQIDRRRTININMGYNEDDMDEDMLQQRADAIANAFIDQQQDDYIVNERIENDLN